MLNNILLEFHLIKTDKGWLVYFTMMPAKRSDNELVDCPVSALQVK